VLPGKSEPSQLLLCQLQEGCSPAFQQLLLKAWFVDRETIETSVSGCHARQHTSPSAAAAAALLRCCRRTTTTTLM
jgi:hypothetical protein